MCSFCHCFSSTLPCKTDDDLFPEVPALQAGAILVKLNPSMKAAELSYAVNKVD